MKFYCTKYWHSQGIIEFEGSMVEYPGGDFAKETRSSHSWGTLFLPFGKEAFTSLADAEADVEQKAKLNMHAKERALKKAKGLLQAATEHSIKVVKR